MLIEVKWYDIKHDTRDAAFRVFSKTMIATLTYYWMDGRQTHYPVYAISNKSLHYLHDFWTWHSMGIGYIE